MVNWIEHYLAVKKMMMVPGQNEGHGSMNDQKEFNLLTLSQEFNLAYTWITIELKEICQREINKEDDNAFVFGDCMDNDIHMFDNYADNPMCGYKKVLSSGPFQISAMNPTPILRDATFQLISWRIRLTDWLVSKHFQNCSTITATMERSLIRWVMGTRKRSKRDIVDTVLGGVGTGLGVVNSIDISSLTPNLQSEGLLNSKGLHTQQTINTLVEGLTKAVIDIQGPAVQHIQEILVGVIGRLREVSWDFVCLSMQTELSTDFKILAQAMDNNHTLLGGWQQAEMNSFYWNEKVHVSFIAKGGM
ncbi:uncharacterized protein O3C94_018614 [Discoglossus pictus]